MVNFSRQSDNCFVKWWWTVDKIILFVAMALLTIGIILDISASPVVARRIGLDDYAMVRKQIQFSVLAVGTMLGLSLFGLKTIRRISILMFAVLTFLLILTMFFGFETKGARRWIYIMGVSLQTSELIKPIFIVLVAWLLDCGKKYDYFPGMWVSFGLYIFLCGLLLLQPDVGMTILVSAVFWLQMFLAGLPWLLVCGLALLGVMGAVTAYFVFPHVHARVDQFLYGSDETSYQIEKAMEAFESGNLFGRGPGEGVVKLSVPDAHTDFVLAVAGEEYGVWGSLIIVALYSAIVLRTMKGVLKESNLFVMYAVVGLSATLGVQAFINMASSLQLIPTKGMTLPFISYGGSSLLGVAITVGMLLAITRKNTASEDKDMFR